MKVAILTYWESSNNYGQILQCFALQRYLINLGIDAYLVKYSPASEKLVGKYKVLHLLKHVAKVLHLRKYIENKRFYKNEKRLKLINDKLNIQREFELFRKQYINSTDKIYHSIDELRADPPDAEVYICGSDQVWRDKLKFQNTAGWYLQFGKKNIKRISYAASIGRNINIDEKSIFVNYLKSFNAISLRERNALEYCKKIGYGNAQVVCDPTFLLTSNYYKDFFDIKLEDAIKPYIFFYTINVTSKEDILWDYIKQHIDENNWNIKAVSSTGYIQARDLIPENKTIQATVVMWLKMIYNSSFVITSSFHGVVFCILFHKPFIVIPLRGENSVANDRIKSLLSFVSLETCFCYDENELGLAFNQIIDWKSVDKKTDELRKSGEDFLKRNL
jgi:hypothetical protein